MKPTLTISKVERLFRVAGDVDIDKGDLARFNDFRDRKVYDLLARGEETAKLKGHQYIMPADLPITKGLQESMNAFRKLDKQEEVELWHILDALTKRPPFELEYSADVEALLPKVAGGLTVALARSFKVLDPELKNPTYPDWDRTFELYDLLL